MPTAAGSQLHSALTVPGTLPIEPARVWNVASGKLVQTSTGHNGKVLGVAFSPTSPAILASAGEDNAVRLWNVNTSQPVGAPLGRSHRACAWSGVQPGRDAGGQRGS